MEVKPKKRKRKVFVALKISIAYGFFVCNIIAKMKSFLYCFYGFDVFCEAIKL